MRTVKPSLIKARQICGQMPIMRLCRARTGQELAQALTVSEKTSPPLHEGLAAIFNNLLLEKIGDEKLKAKLDKYPHPGFLLEAGSHTGTCLL